MEANSELTWRDIQHIIVETSNPDMLLSVDWQLNGANRKGLIFKNLNNQLNKQLNKLFKFLS